MYLCLATNERFLKRRVIHRKGLLHLNISSYLNHELASSFLDKLSEGNTFVMSRVMDHE